MKELQKPKATDVNPFVLFYKSKVLERGNASINEHMAVLSQRWKTMETEEKKSFTEKAKINSEIYRKRLIEWENKMLSEGHPYLLRQSVLRKLDKKQKLFQVENNSLISQSSLTTRAKQLLIQSKLKKPLNKKRQAMKDESHKP